MGPEELHTQRALGEVAEIFFSPIYWRSAGGLERDRPAVERVRQALSEQLLRDGPDLDAEDAISKLFAYDLLNFKADGLFGIGPEKRADWRRAIGNLFNPETVATEIQQVRDAYRKPQWQQIASRYAYYYRSYEFRGHWEAQWKRWPDATAFIDEQLGWMESVRKLIALVESNRPPLVNQVLSEMAQCRDHWLILRQRCKSDEMSLTEPEVQYYELEQLHETSYKLHREVELYCGASYAWQDVRMG